MPPGRHENGSRSRFVVYATRGAISQAARLGVEGCLENRIGERIRDGRMSHRWGRPGGPRLAGSETLVWLSDQIAAIVRKEDRSPDGSRRLRVLRVLRAEQRSTR